MHGPLGSINQVCGCISCNPSVKEAEAGGSDIQGHLGCSGVGDQSEIHETMSLKQKKILAGVVTHSFNSRDRRISEFKTNLIYRVSARTAELQEKPCL